MYVGWGVTEWYQEPKPVLVDEEEDSEEDKFEKEQDPQEEEDDIESEPKDAIEVENLIKHGDATIPASVHEVVRSSVEQGTPAMERLVEKLGNTEDKAECKRLKKELEETRSSNTFLRMQNERVERDLYWTRVQAHEFYQEMIRKGFVFEERPNEAINENVNDAIAAERARHANVGNEARGSGTARGQDATPAARAVELLRWFEKTESVFGISDCAEGKKVRFAAATLQVEE
ncbi:hypothetical protein Tco_0355450 [Tanacetum coccineum]